MAIVITPAKHRSCIVCYFSAYIKRTYAAWLLRNAIPHCLIVSIDVVIVSPSITNDLSNR